MGDPYPGKVKFQGGKPWTISYEAVVASLALGGWPEKHWAKAAAVVAAESNKTVNIYNTYLEGHWGLMQIGKKQHPDFFKNDVHWMVPFLNCGEGYRIFQRQGWGAWEAATNGRYVGFMLQATSAVNNVKSKRSRTTKSMGDFYLSLYGKDEEAFVYMAAAPGLGAVNKHIGDAIGAGAEELGDTIEATGPALADAIAQTQANSFFSAATLLVGAGRWIADPANWMRVGQVVIGGGLLLAGISIAAKPVTTGAVKAAASVAPVTRAAGKAGRALKSVGSAA